MNDFRLIAEVNRFLSSCKLKEPVDGHVVQAVHVKMGKMDFGACREGENSEREEKRYKI